MHKNNNIIYVFKYGRQHLSPFFLLCMFLRWSYIWLPRMIAFEFLCTNNTREKESSLRRYTPSNEQMLENDMQMYVIIFWIPLDFVDTFHLILLFSFIFFLDNDMIYSFTYSLYCNGNASSPLLNFWFIILLSPLLIFEKNIILINAKVRIKGHVKRYNQISRWRCEKMKCVNIRECRFSHENEIVST